MTLTLTYDLDLQSPASYGHELRLSKSSMSTVSIGSKIEWKQTDGQTEGGDCITSLTNAVGKMCLAFRTKIEGTFTVFVR